MSEEPSGEDERTVVVFRLADREFATDVLHVREIVRLSTITRMPRTAVFLLGMVNLRGRVVPLLDLRKYLDLPESPPTANTRVVIISREGGAMLGLLVDSVVEVLILGNDSVDAPPQSLDTVGPLLTGVARVGTRILLMLDLQRVASGLESEESA